MRNQIIRIIDKIFRLKLESSEETVGALKQEAKNKVKTTQKTLKHAGHLQTEVMQKTTTYYLGKAVGAIKESK